MQCEICGKYMDEGKKIKLMGATITVCEGCSRHGKVIATVGAVKKKPAEKLVPKPIELKIAEPEEVIVEGFSSIIKNARERLNMKQEDLAKNIKEPVSVVRRIESGFEPTLDIAKKIENVLKVKLIEKSEKFELPEKFMAKIDKSTEELTLGDIVIVKNKRK